MKTVFKITCPHTNCTANFDQEHFDYLDTLLNNQESPLARDLHGGLLWAMTSDSYWLVYKEDVE